MNKNGELAIHGGRPLGRRVFPVTQKHDLAEWRAVKSIFARGEIHMTRGPEVMRLRETACRTFGMKHCVTVCNGTAAIHTALAALGIGRGDEVITTPCTDMGTLIGILQLNAVPVFADVDPHTYMMTPATIEARITPRTRAILVVHLSGLCADMTGIMRVARKCAIPVVEDCAQSYMCTWKGRVAGTMGAINCWSLNETKHIGAGDGGFILTDDPALAARADLFADKCYDRTGTSRRPFFAPMNYRLNTLVAGVCLEQFKKLRGVVARRTLIGGKLDKLLSGIDGITPRPIPAGCTATYLSYVFSFDSERMGVAGAEFARALNLENSDRSWVRAFENYGVLSWPLFTDRPDDHHACGEHCPKYKGRIDFDLRNFPGVRQAYRHGILVGLDIGLRDRDLALMAAMIAKVARGYLARKG